MTMRMKRLNDFPAAKGILVAAALLAALALPAPGACTGAAAGPDPFDEAPAYAPKDGGAAKNPFEPLIEPATPLVAPEAAQPRVEPVRAVPPLPLSLIAVVGNDARRLALLELNGATYELAAGEAEPGGLFNLVEIRESSVVVFDSRAGKNRVIELK